MLHLGVAWAMLEVFLCQLWHDMSEQAVQECMWSDEFWAFFGGFAPIGNKKVASDDDIILEKTPPNFTGIIPLFQL